MKDTNSKTSTTADPKERIEFKINRYQVAWEQTPVTSWEEMTKAEAQAKAQEIANKYQRVIRWNIAGSYQGHYVLPNISKEAEEGAKDIMKQTPQPEHKQPTPEALRLATLERIALYEAQGGYLAAKRLREELNRARLKAQGLTSYVLRQSKKTRKEITS